MIRSIFLFLLVFGAAYAVLGSQSKSPAPVVLPTTRQSSATKPSAPAPVVQNRPEEESAADQIDDAVRLERFWKQLMAETVARRTQFEVRLVSLKLDRLYDADVLINPDAYDPARRDLRAARQLVDQYETASNQAIASLPTRLVEAGIHKQSRELAIKSFNSAPLVRGKFLSRAMKLERDRIEQLTVLLDFLEPRLSKTHNVVGALVCDSKIDDAILLQHFRNLATNREARRMLEAEGKAATDKSHKAVSNAVE